MCELFCLSSRLPTRATFSLRTFASHGAFGGTTIDGWGVAFYDGADIRLYKEPEPAGDTTWLAFIERRHIAASLVLSHIRRATIGGISLANTQPFVRELGGRMHVFAHNGRLDGVINRHGSSQSRFRPVGLTDSEAVFCVLLERLAPLWSSGAVPKFEDRLATIARFATEMRQIGPANFFYGDSDTLFAHGHKRIQASGTIEPPGLWLLRRECAVDPDGFPQAGVTIETPEEAQAIILLASVPLTDEEWRPLAEGELVAIKDGRIIVSAVDRRLAATCGKER